VTIDVPPGEYLLALHRVESGDAVETVTLTPLAHVEAPKRSSAVLPFPVDKPKHKWLGKYEIEGRRFQAQGCFVDYWEFIDLNLDRAAGEKLQLGPGSVIDVDIEGRRIVFALLGEAIPYTIGAQRNARQLFGYDRTTGEIANEPEVAMATWRRYDDETDVEILRAVRVRRTNQPTEKSGKWQNITGTVRAERLPQPDLADVEKWRREGDAVAGKALVVMDKLITVSLSPDALAALGAKSGEVVTVEAGGAARSMLIAGSAAEAQALMQRRARRPLVGFFDKFWLDPGRAVFVVWPLGGNSVGGELPCKPGDDVKLRR
jgi:hypothetical protein